MSRNIHQFGLGDIGTCGHGEGDGGGKADPSAAFEALLAKHKSDATAVARLLFDENYKLRTKNARLADAAKRAPAEGSVVLTVEQGKAWEAYQKLGAPEELAGKVQSTSEAAKELAALKRERLIAEAAEAHKMRSGALQKLVGDALIELKEETKDGQKSKVALVRDGDKTVGLEDYITQHWGEEFLSSVRSETPKATGTQFVPQQAGGRAPKADPVDAFIEAQNRRAAAKGNPLIPQTNK